MEVCSTSAELYLHCKWLSIQSAKKLCILSESPLVAPQCIFFRCFSIRKCQHGWLKHVHKLLLQVCSGSWYRIKNCLNAYAYVGKISSSCGWYSYTVRSSSTTPPLPVTPPPKYSLSSTTTEWEKDFLHGTSLHGFHLNVRGSCNPLEGCAWDREDWY